ncbi:MAG: hypothetical protein KF788_22090 [Piscinibacter sp.]|nr:hypothetical protein [Piscinibacter sp.]
MNADVHAILQQLEIVERERVGRAADAAWSAAVRSVKAFQRDRFARTYADLLAAPRYAAAARFFLDELYGPQDFSERDAQFARVVPALVRLFPPEIVATVHTLARLHALSEELDSAMGWALRDGVALDGAGYVRAWQATGRPEAREEQIRLTLAVGVALDRLTRKPLLRHALHLMRGPARAAGLAALQQFLESGFDTFRAMGGAEDFLGRVGDRERALAAALFAPGADANPESLGQLP